MLLSVSSLLLYIGERDLIPVIYVYRSSENFQFFIGLPFFIYARIYPLMVLERKKEYIKIHTRAFRSLARER